MPVEIAVKKGVWSAQGAGAPACRGRAVTDGVPALAAGRLSASSRVRSPRAA